MILKWEETLNKILQHKDNPTDAAEMVIDNRATYHNFTFTNEQNIYSKKNKESFKFGG